MRKYILALSFLLFAMLSIAQQGDKDSRREQIKALQIAFITEKLELTTAESQKFWPIHNAYEANSRKTKDRGRRSSEIEGFTEKEALQYLEEKIKVDEELVALKKEYIEDLQSVLSAKKIALLFKAEYEFKRKVIRSMKSHDDKSKRKEN